MKCVHIALLCWRIPIMDVIQRIWEILLQKDKIDPSGWLPNEIYVTHTPQRLITMTSQER